MPRVQAIVVRDDTVLMVKHRQHGQEWWCLPGGGQEPGETPEQGALRELREECRVTGTIVRPTSWVGHAPADSAYSFLVDIGEQTPVLGHDPELVPGHEILVDVRWLRLREIPERDRVFLWAAGLLGTGGFLAEVEGWGDAPSYPDPVRSSAAAVHITQTRPGDEFWHHIQCHSPQTVGYIADPNDHGDYRCFVALDPADTFLGLCIIDIGRLGFGPLADQRVACLENILVREDQRRQGTGAALLRSALALAWQEGADHVWWTVGYENTEAIAFYHAMGAAFIAEEDPDAEAPERYYTAVIQNPGKGRTAAASATPCR